MHIGFMIPTTFALDGPANGVRNQAVHQAEALRALGHTVTLMDPWGDYPLAEMDGVQFFTGGYPLFPIHTKRPRPVKHLIFAPMIDSNESNRRYRVAARLGTSVPRFDTIPGMFRRQAEACSLIVARSTHERQRVLEGLGIDPAKNPVEIVLNGVNPPGEVDPGPARKAYDLPEQFILHVSAYTQARKNVVRMIEAIGPTGLPLVIAGSAPEGPGLERVKAAAAKYKQVRLMGYLPRELMTSFYGAARLFCLPSIHEGTGLVALEAAACGAGVVITEHGGPPDYFRSHAQYCDPYSVESIRTAVQKAWENPQGEVLRQHVLTHLTWRQSAEALAAAYRKHLV